MTFWRRRREVAATFFRILDGRKGTRTDDEGLPRDRSGRRGSPRNSPRCQIPSLLLMSSLTAFGLALPPDAFITCPTNHPTIAGLALACATLSGFRAMISSTI